MRFLAKLQGASAHVAYTEHLKLVHPDRVERCFRANGLKWINRVEWKFRRVAEGDDTDVVAYRCLARVFKLLRIVKLSGLAIRTCMLLRLYPSLFYTAHKPLCTGKMSEYATQPDCVTTASISTP
jgi:hypothetical protein